MNKLQNTTEFQKIVNIEDLQKKTAKNSRTQKREVTDMNKLQNTATGDKERVIKMLEKVNKMKQDKEDVQELPEIQPQDKVVKLCKRDGYYLNMMGIADRATKRMKGYKLFLSDDTGVSYIGSDNGLVISKERLMEADNNNIMNCIRQFQVNFNENDVKDAYTRAKRFAEINKVVFSDNMDKNITEAYQDVVRYVLDIVKEENNTNTYKYDEVSKVVSISAKKMQEVLDMVAPNFKKIEFCKRLSELQFKEDVEIIISNRSGKKGYGYNETGNKMYYKFRIIDRLMKAGA